MPASHGYPSSCLQAVYHHRGVFCSKGRQSRPRACRKTGQEGLWAASDAHSHVDVMIVIFRVLQHSSENIEYQLQSSFSFPLRKPCRALQMLASADFHYMMQRILQGGHSQSMLSHLKRWFHWFACVEEAESVRLRHIVVTWHIWMVLDGAGWCWMVLDGAARWWWMVLDGAGWWWWKMRQYLRVIHFVWQI